jgi:hypothetical protein
MGWCAVAVSGMTRTTVAVSMQTAISRRRYIVGQGTHALCGSRCIMRWKMRARPDRIYSDIQSKNYPDMYYGYVRGVSGGFVLTKQILTHVTYDRREMEHHIERMTTAVMDLLFDEPFAIFWDRPRVYPPEYDKGVRREVDMIIYAKGEESHGKLLDGLMELYRNPL